MKTYVKIYGPPLLEALDALQKIAEEMPKVTHYHLLAGYEGVPVYPYGAGTYAGVSPAVPPQPIPAVAATRVPTGAIEAATHPAISKSGYTLGEYDFFFEWREEPTWNEIRDLIAKIDKALSPLGCRYTLTSK